MHIFSFVSFPEKTCLVKVEKGDQPTIRIQSGQRFGQYEKLPFFRSIGWLKEGGGQKAEVGGQRSEDRRQRTDDRSQRSEVRGKKKDDGGQKTESEISGQQAGWVIRKLVKQMNCLLLTSYSFFLGVCFLGNRAGSILPKL